ncbi:MAG: flagellar biosynthetic protein FliR [bacterium]|nr:flagellar biosynthetic protein FliR [bacterium]
MNLSLPWITSLFFIVIRIGTVLLFTPIQAIRQLPIHARLLFIFIFSMLLVNYVPNSIPLTDTRILIGGVAEFSNGLILATSLSAAFAVFQIAGQLIDNELGINSLAIFNPSEHSHEPLTSHLFSMLAILFFFGMSGHIWLFKGLAYSFTISPPGSLTLFKGFLPVIKQLTFVFSFSFMIASPIIVALLTVDLCGAVITRNMPQVSTYFLTLPIKIGLGLILLIMMMHYFRPISDLVFERCFQTWQELLS